MARLKKWSIFSFSDKNPAETSQGLHWAKNSQSRFGRAGPDSTSPPFHMGLLVSDYILEPTVKECISTSAGDNIQTNQSTCFKQSAHEALEY